VLAGALVFLARFLRIAWLRIAFPYDLEWLEGVSVDHLDRLTAGLPLYTEPSLDWVPFSYPPVYYLAALPFVALTGVGYLPLRIVSVLASLATMSVLALLAYRETRSRTAAVAAAGLFAATYRLGGAWFDVARVDALFLFFSLAALALIALGTSLRSAAVAGLALALAALTKQTAMGLAPALFLAALPNPRRALVLTAACAAVWFPAVAILHHTSGGWFTYYAFHLPSKHYEYHCAPHFWNADVLNPLPIASALALLTAVGTLVTRRVNAFVRLVVPCLALIASAWISRRHCGGYDNVLMPLHAALALLSALAVGYSLSSTRPWIPGVLLLAVPAQLVLLNYSDDAQIPTARDRAAYDDLVVRVRSTPGDVWVFQHPRVAHDAGKNTFAHWMAICDVLRDPDVKARARMGRAINDALDTKRFAAIITDDHYFPALIGRRYIDDHPFFESPDVLWPRTGMPTRPSVYWSPR
jgi:4-amino-4-deoxy-L-arabinose transferase-like glycosyltransferase